MSRGKNNNPLTGPSNRKAAFRPIKEVDILEIKPLPFEPVFKTSFQNDVSDVIATHLESEAAEFEMTVNEWIFLREEGAKYQLDKYNLMHKLGFYKPFISKEMADKISSSKDNPQPSLSLSYEEGECYINPWNDGSSYAFATLLSDALIYGPKGQEVAASLLLPALQKHIQLCKMFHGDSRYAAPNRIDDNLRALEKWQVRLEKLQVNGAFDSDDAVKLQRELQQVRRATKGYYSINQRKEIDDKWHAAASDILSKAKDLRDLNNTKQGLRLILTFTGYPGVPHDTVAHDALDSPAWTKEL